MSEQFSMMKKASLFILCLICTLAFSIPAFAEPYTLTGADVAISDAGTISSYKLNDKKDLIIPEKINGITVITIGNDAFSGHEEIESVVLPDSLLKIGQRAFSGTSLGSKKKVGELIIPSSVRTIEMNAFGNCKLLGSVKFMDDESAGESDRIDFYLAESYPQYSIFGGCNQLKSIELSNLIKIIPREFAWNCSKLETVKWSAELTEIMDDAFIGTGLKSVDLSGTGLTTIGERAFANCENLSSVKFPKSLTTLKNDAFGGAAMGTEEIPGNLVIPSSVSTIKSGAFGGCPHLGTVTFENYSGNLADVDAIEFIDLLNGGYFSYCPELTSITLSNRLQTIPQNFANNCEKLKTVNWSKELTTIGASAFREDPLLISSNLSNTSLKSIGGCAFMKCTSLPVVEFPDTLETIDSSAFEGSGMGTRNERGELTIPSNVETIGNNAFSGCLYLQKVVFGPDNGYVYPMELNSGIFSNCNNLIEITVSDRIKIIPAGFAPECKNLIHITIANGIEEIGGKAFYLSSDELYDTIIDSTNAVAKNYDWAGDNRRKSDTASVVLDVVLNKTETKIEVGKTEKLTADIKMYPKDAVKPGITWKAENPNYVSVNEDGLIKGEYVGSTTITVKTDRGNKSDSCVVTVVPAESISEYTVTFISNGTEIDSKTVAKNDLVTKPSDPERDGYTFTGWYTDIDCKDEYDFTTPVTGNITLYAGWEGGTDVTGYTVTFMSNGKVIDSKTVSKNGLVEKPSAPEREGFTFTGWYTDSACTKEYDFSTPVTSSFTLYAGWREKGGSEEGEKTDEFTLKRDNNSWYHTSASNGGFEGKKDYSFNNDRYYNDLIRDRPSNEISYIKNRMYLNWVGSSFGIASTMSLLYQGKHSPDQYSDTKAEHYYDLPKPADDKKFMDVINYYQLSKYGCRSSLRITLRKDPYPYSVTPLDDFLKGLYETSAKKIPKYFCYNNNPATQGAHTILTVNSGDNEDGSHFVKFYDMDSYDPDGGQYIYMDISADYSKFSLTDGNGHVINEDNYLSMELGDWRKISLLSSETKDTAQILGTGDEADSNHALISIKGNTEIKNSKGENLKYEDGLFSGNMEVYNVNLYAAEEASRMEVEVDDSEYFTLEGSVQDVSVGSSKGFMSVEGSGFDGVTLSYEDGVKMKGENYSFKAFVQTDNTIEGNEKGLASVSGKCTGESVVKKDGDNVKATTTGTFTDIVTSNYIGIKKDEEKISGSVTEITVDTKRATDDEPDDPDNPDGPKKPGTDKPIITVSDNKPMDYDVDVVGGFKVGYNHSVPFFGKSKPTAEYFGEITVSSDSATYTVSKIKVNTKKKTIQITGLQGADKDTIKAIKKATKGTLKFNINPYYVRDNDGVVPKRKKDGTVKSVKIMLNGKYYKAKKGEWSLESDNLIKFSSQNLDGSFHVS